jgi:hypothetical protein
LNVAESTKQLEYEKRYMRQFNENILTNRLVDEARRAEPRSTNDMNSILDTIDRIDKNDIIKAKDAIIDYANKAIIAESTTADEKATFGKAITRTEEAYESIMEKLTEDRGSGIALARKYIHDDNSAEKYLFQVVLKNKSSDKGKERARQDTPPAAGPSQQRGNLEVASASDKGKQNLETILKKEILSKISSNDASALHLALRNIKRTRGYKSATSNARDKAQVLMPYASKVHTFLAEAPNPTGKITTSVVKEAVEKLRAELHLAREGLQKCDPIDKFLRNLGSPDAYDQESSGS